MISAGAVRLSVLVLLLGRHIGPGLFHHGRIHAVARHVFDVDPEAIALAGELFPFVGHPAHDAAHQTVERLVLIGGQLDIQLFSHFLQVGRAADLPAAVAQLADLQETNQRLAEDIANSQDPDETEQWLEALTE